VDEQEQDTFKGIFTKNFFEIQMPINNKVVDVNTKIWYKKESDLWAQLDEKSVQKKESFFKRIRQKSLRSAVCFRSAKGLFALILRDCVVTWPKRKEQMDG
jgi:hypothetical protein